jgi:RimJ/RimL family protein N-acetyltransferase
LSSWSPFITQQRRRFNSTDYTYNLYFAPTDFGAPARASFTLTAYAAPSTIRLLPLCGDCHIWSGSHLSARFIEITCMKSNERQLSMHLPDLHPDENILETSRLWLRSMRADDTDALFAIFTDPSVMAAFDSPPFSREQMTSWLNRNLDHQHRYGYGLFSVILKQNRLLIGDCGLEVVEIGGFQVAELGYDFRSDIWNQGYATEATTAVRDFALQQLHLPRLISLIRIGNQPSRRVAEKIGMHFVSEVEHDSRHYWKYAIDAEDKAK